MPWIQTGLHDYRLVHQVMSQREEHSCVTCAHLEINVTCTREGQTLVSSPTLAKCVQVGCVLCINYYESYQVVYESH